MFDLKVARRKFAIARTRVIHGLAFVSETLPLPKAAAIAWMEVAPRPGILDRSWRKLRHSEAGNFRCAACVRKASDTTDQTDERHERLGLLQGVEKSVRAAKVNDAIHDEWR